MTKKEEHGIGYVYRRRHRNKHGKWVRSPLYWIGFYHRGRMVKKSAKTDNRAEANEFLKRQIELAMGGKLLLGKAERMKITDLTNLVVRDYTRNKRKSLDRAQDGLDHLDVYFGSTRAVEIDEDAIVQYMDYRLEIDHAANATVSYELALLKRAFHLARKALGPRPDFPVLNVSNTRRGFLEESDLQTLLPCLPADIQPIILFAYITGWRMKSEIFPLQWPQVDFGVGQVRLEPGTTKNDDGRTFPIGLVARLDKLLRDQYDRTQDLQRELGRVIPWVFHRQGREIKSIRGAWERAVERAKIGDRIPHDFRRTAIRNLERAGVPRGVAMQMVGHKTEAIYRRYAIVAPKDIQDGGRRLNDLLNQMDQTPKVVPMPPRQEEQG